jgi:hypothetical protein
VYSVDTGSDKINHKNVFVVVILIVEILSNANPDEASLVGMTVKHGQLISVAFTYR